MSVIVLGILRACVSRLLAPPTCAACDVRIRRTAVFCAPCAATIHAVEHPTFLADVAPGNGSVDLGTSALRVAAFAVFGGALATAVHKLKYHDRSDLGRPLGHLLRRTARRAGLLGTLVVPVPLHPRRLVERGYNQAALLAGEVAKEIDAPMETMALARTAFTRQQAGLGRAERLTNMADAFVVRRASRLRHRRVVLVDDVLTTGATLLACARALREGGAASVHGLVLAQADGLDAECAGSSGAGQAERPPAAGGCPGTAGGRI